MDPTTDLSGQPRPLAGHTLLDPLPVTSRFVRLLSFLACVVLIAVVLVPPQWAFKNLQWFDYIYPAALWSGMLLVAVWPGMLTRAGSDRCFITTILGLFVVSRLIWVLLVPTLPFSDFAEYNHWASIFGQFQPVHGDMYRLSINLAQQPWLYPISLGVLYDIFGQHLIVAKLANVVAGTLSTFLVYLLARQIFGSPVARLAALLFLLWPTQLMYTSVLASEHFALVLSLSAFVFLMPVFREEKKNYRKVMIAGVFLALSFATRYSIIVALPSFILAISLTRRAFKWKASHTTLLIAGFVITFSLYLGAVALIWRQVPLPNGGLHLLMGTNAASGGTHIDSDTVLYESHATMAEANQFARAEALRRIRANPLGYIALMADKSVVYWKDEYYGQQYSTREMSPGAAKAFLTAFARPLGALTQFFHLSVLLLGFVGCFFLIFRGGDSRLILILLVFLGGTLLHSITVVQARYHYPSEPLLLILGASGLVSLSFAFPRLAGLVKYKSEGLMDVVDASYPQPQPAETNPGSPIGKKYSSPFNRLTRRNIALLGLATGVIFLISTWVLQRSLGTTSNQTTATISANPNPVIVCDGSGLGITTVSYTFPMGRLFEVHIDSPDGPLFATPAVQGTSTTGKWVADGMVFFLQDITGGKLPSKVNTVATTTVQVTAEGCQ